ncbi:MAG: cold shock domain-containing protein [Planctomycetota bacterium]
MTRSPLSKQTPKAPTVSDAAPFRIQKKRLGRIKTIKPDKNFGFIDADDFRDDVFFHFNAWEGSDGASFEEDSYVEFELDDDHFDKTKKLRAKVFRATKRPDGRKLTARDADFDIVHHHPNARRRRPSWRDKTSE